MLGTLNEKKDEICSCKNITFRMLKSVHKNHACLYETVVILVLERQKNAWEATKLDKWIQCRKELYGKAIVFCCKEHHYILLRRLLCTGESHFMRTFMAMTSADHDNIIADWEEVCVIETSSRDFSFSSWWCHRILMWWSEKEWHLSSHGTCC